MEERRRRIDRFVVVGAVTAVLLGFALLSDGFSAFRVEPRPLSGQAAQLHAALNSVEERLPAGGRTADGRWRGYLQNVHQALEARDVSDAIRSWHDARAAALESRDWQAMLEVGEAAVAIGQASGSRVASRTTATDAYLIALVRARRDGSLDGALRVAEAFAALSDRAAVRQSLRVADRIAADHRDAAGRERVRRLETRLDEPIVSTTEP